MSTTQKQRDRIKERDGYQCRGWWVCPDVPCGGGLEVDHIIPLGRGGKDDDVNLWTLCSYCHKLKHEHPEAATYLGFYGRETFNKKYDQIDPETFGNYVQYWRTKKLLLAGGHYAHPF